MKRIILFIQIIVSLLSIVACNDNDSFSESKSNILSFSSDTIKMDTVFSKVPSSTRSFWIYNNSGDGIRVASIKLEKGNQTGFRVNIDGTDLTSRGYQTSNVEIRKGDSIRVFVELTSGYTNELEPKKLEDNLACLLESGVTQKVNLNAWSWDATVMRNSEIKGDTTLSSEKPIIVYGILKVDSNATLGISAGTSIFFHDGAGIDVYGTLKSIGDIGKFITLRGDRLDNMLEYLPYNMVSGQWRGIHIYSSSVNNEIGFTDIHSSEYGIECDSASTYNSKLNMYNSIIHNCKGNGLTLYNCKADIENCQISNALGDCVAIYGGNVSIMNTTIAQFYPFDSERGVALRFANKYNEWNYALSSLRVTNSIITGYSDDELMGEKDNKDIDFNYNFDHCLICTPHIDNDKSMSNIIWEAPDSINAQDKNFKIIDTKNLRYDFRLNSQSKAINAGIANSLIYDLNGKKRDDTPDLGCYEY